MNNWFQRFLYGRYGNDDFGIFLLICATVVMLAGAFITNAAIKIVLLIVTLALLSYLVYRTFSRQLNKRIAENDRFRCIWRGITGWFKLQWLRVSQAKTHRFFTCPQCKAVARVPKGKGKIAIKCPKCGAEYIRKT